MSTPPNPMLDQNTALMQQSQQTMNNPMTSGVPQPGGIPGIENHPVIQAIGQALAKAMQNIGFAGAAPEQRLAGQQMENQKAETMARLAQTGAYQMGSLDVARQKADTGQQRADTAQQDVESKETTRAGQLELGSKKLDLATEANAWKKDIAEGRLEQARQRISNQASQFEKTLQIRIQQVGINQAKLELEKEGLGIKQGFLDLAGTALSQKGTSEGLNTITKLQGLAYEHPLLSHVFGLDDVNSAVGKAQGAGIPGTAPIGTAPQSAAPIQTPAPATNKIDAKRNQKKGKPGDPLGIL